MTETQLIPKVAVFMATAQKINALQQRLDAARRAPLIAADAIRGLTVQAAHGYRAPTDEDKAAVNRLREMLLAERLAAAQATLVQETRAVANEIEALRATLPKESAR